LATEIEMKLSIVGGHRDEHLLILKSGLNVLGFGLGLGQKKEQAFQASVLKNAYYDSASWQLNTLKVALRIRQKTVAGGTVMYIQTLKTKGNSVDGLSQRGEWEWVLPTNKLNVSALHDNEAWPLEVDPDSLIAVFETNFTRYTLDFTWNNSKIELALDQGEILSQGKQEQINEIELELKSGNVSDLHLLRAELQNMMTLTPSDISKAERGYRLFHA